MERNWSCWNQSHPTGPYFTVVGTTSIGSRRADYLGSSVALLSDQQTAQHYFNTAAFGPANNNRYGTAGVGTVQGPGFSCGIFQLESNSD